MDEATRTQPDLTQPMDTTVLRVRPRESRRFRLFRTIVFGLAILVGIATIVVIATRDGGSFPNSSGVFSPSGHLPSEPSRNRNVSISWTGVEGAAGYWWAMVEDPARLPQPVIRPSGNDRRVYFRFSGRGYFALRTAYRVEGRIEWSDELLYGPIVVLDPAVQTIGPSTSPGPSDGAGATDEPGSSGDGGSGGSASGDEDRPRATVDPRLAGQQGECPADGGQCGGAGEPGQPAQQPGGGGSNGPRSGNEPGTPGEPGPDGPPGLR